MTKESMNVLIEHAIPFEPLEESTGEERVIIRAEGTKPEELRELGFRLGHGIGDMQYILYFQGEFCGFVA